MLVKVKITEMGFLFYIMSFLIVGCSSESPDVKYQGISAQNAVKLLNQAKTTQATDNVITRVSRDPQYGFQWQEFWTGVAPLTADMKEEQRAKLFALGNQSCTQQSYNAFASTVLPYSNYFNLVLNQTKSCNESLNDENLKNYFHYYRPRLRTASVEEYGLFRDLLQKARPDSQTGLRDLMDEVSSRDWTKIIRRSLDQQETDVTIDLVNTYGDVYGANGLVDVVFLPLTENKDGFLAFLKAFGFSKTMDFVLSLPSQFFNSEERTAEQWQDVLSALTQDFLASDYLLRTYATIATQGYQDYSKLHMLMKYLDKKVPMTFLLSEFDVQTRFMEKLLFGSEDVFFLQTEPSLLTLWLEERIFGKIESIDLLNVVNNEDSLTPLEKIYYRRLQVFFVTKEADIHRAIESYCQLLAETGVVERQVPSIEFNGNLLTTPGCVRVESRDNQEAILWTSAKSVEMSMSSVLITSGISLVIEMPRFDGSVIDLSSTYVYPDLPAQSARPEDHALVFPVVMGFQIKNEVDSFSPGIYYIVTHYTARKAAPGRPSGSVPLKGHDGGDLLLKVTDPQGSYAPQVVSQGGKGQKAVPVTEGGRADTSSFRWDEVQKNLLSTNYMTDDFSQDRYLLTRPTVKKISDLWSHAEKRADDTGDVISTFVDADVWWRSLPLLQQQKVLEYCQEDVFSQTCANGLAEKAAEQVKLEIHQLGKDYPSNTGLERIALLDFTEPAGDPGPVNANGEDGESGFLQMEGFK